MKGIKKTVKYETATFITEMSMEKGKNIKQIKKEKAFTLSAIK